MTSPKVSFEVFPPRNVDAAFNLWDTAQALAPLAPRFFSVTYGAGGTTRDVTHDAAHVLRRTSGLPVAAHLTCVGASKDETMEVAENFAKIGVTDIVALRGDPQGICLVANSVGNISGLQVRLPRWQFIRQCCKLYAESAHRQLSIHPI